KLEVGSWKLEAMAGGQTALESAGSSAGSSVEGVCRIPIAREGPFRDAGEEDVEGREKVVLEGALTALGGHPPIQHAQVGVEEHEPRPLGIDPGCDVTAPLARADQAREEA